MRLSTLLGPRTAGAFRPSAIAYEGPLGGTRRSLTQAEVALSITGLGSAVADRCSTRRARVGVLSNHQLETYTTVLASVAAGHTFVPLNPKFPEHRLQQIVELAGLDLVVHDADTAALAPIIAGALPLLDATALLNDVLATPADDSAVSTLMERVGSTEVDSSDIAYVMFTSGSTGTPKGVPVTFGSLTAYVTSICALIDFPVDARHTQFFDLSFDLSIHDIFVSHHADGVLVAPTKIDHMMPAAYVRRERIDVWFSVPLLGAQLARAARPDGVDGMAIMMFCGEALPMETVDGCRAWLRDRGQVWNLYGPTEATIAFTGHLVGPDEPVVGAASIGAPFGANTVALLHEDGSTSDATTLGAEGELLLGGPQVFGGYSTPAPSPFVQHDGATFYRSGDLVRVEPVGLYYRGRVDSQVKYRGYRIELGEIESAMRRTFGLHSVAVVLRGDGADAQLRAYHLASEAEGDLDMSALGDLLPAYMIPSSVTALDVMPTNANGKIDRRNLP
ncbi:MAG: hypothetical protein RJB65_776 [Actinomycetota bacterium]